MKKQNILTLKIKKKRIAKSKMRRLQKLEKKYSDLVLGEVQKTLDGLGNQLIESFGLSVSKNHDYIKVLASKLGRICNKKTGEKPDSFIVAACLMYSLIELPMVTTNLENVEINNLVLCINIDIALNCALQLISQPITYYECDGKWREEKHSKVEIVVPRGLIKNKSLYERIVKSIYKDYKLKKSSSILQFSNLLHLIYLNCQ